MISALAAAEGAALTVDEFLFVLTAILVSAKLLGELAERIGQPAVLGELLAGVLLGQSVLGVVDPTVPVFHLLAETGIIILLFHIGLETQLGRLMRVGGTAAAVAVAGVVLPFAGGYALLLAFGYSSLPAIVGGAALTATSVGITARVLSDLGRLQDPEGQVVLGAAVIDDVVGLVILAIVAELVAGASITVTGVARSTVLAFGFLVVVLLVGRLVAPPLFRLLSRLGSEHTVATMALALAFVTALVAERSGSALIIGAFAAGLTLAPLPQAHTIEQGVVRLGHFFVPIFFVTVGAALDVRTFADPRVLAVGGGLLVVAFIGKLAAGYVPIWFRGRKIVIGVGMIPRGEVGLIFAQMGLTAAVLSPGLFSAILLMVMVTTFAAPPLLKHLLGPPSPEGLPMEPSAVAELTTEA